MPRKPKPKNALSAGERAAIFETERKKRLEQLSDELRGFNRDDIPDGPGGGDSTTEADAVKHNARAEKPKPRPQSATVSVDFSIPLGEMKPMHGMCNGPVSYGADISNLFAEASVPFVRFDGTDTAMSGFAVDVSRIFRDPSADPSDADNYDFSTTDRYVEAALHCGAKVIFRLGESVDPMFPDKRVDAFTDHNILARVCGNIVRHYNDYWANGYGLGIEYFEIWQHCSEQNECENEFALYSLLAGAVKLVDEKVKVGGICFDKGDVAAREFIRY
jgi:hypothetical protein